MLHWSLSFESKFNPFKKESVEVSFEEAHEVIKGPSLSE